MSYIIGQQIPKPWLGYIRSSVIAAPCLRFCMNCGHEWFTAEVPLYTSWTWGRADCCPKHPGTKSLIKTSRPPQAALKGQYFSRGTKKAFEMGAVYRRRHCYFKSCLDPTSLVSRIHGKMTRTGWTTIELLRNGLICADVTDCPRCPDGSSRVTTARRAKVLRRQRGLPDPT